MTAKLLGRAIRIKRLESGLYQRALANKVGISEATLCRYERGKADITVGHLTAIADALDTNIFEILQNAERYRDVMS